MALVLMDLTPDHMEYHVADGGDDEAAVEDATSHLRPLGEAGSPAPPAPSMSGSFGGGAPAAAVHYTSIELPERGNGGLGGKAL
jgi:hypothetical protein